MNHLELAADLLKIDFQNMYVQWGKNTPPRSGMHASAILDKAFCAREQVLHQLFPEQGEAQTWNSWDWKKSIIFENGWRLHQRWQDLFHKCGNVVYSPVTPEWLERHSKHFEIPLKLIDNQWCAPELDLTHYDEERNLYFSPDAILEFGGEKYIVEIKGIKQEAYLELTDDLEQACNACETVHKAREQANLYCQLLGLKRAILLIENKNTCDFKLWVIESDFERYRPYRDRIYAVKRDVAIAQKHGVNASFPVRLCQSADDPRAKTCPMRNACFIQK